MNKNFIKYNIENVKGTFKPAFHLEDKPTYSSPQKQKYSKVQSSYKQPSLNNRVSQIQVKLQKLQRNRSQSLIVQQISQIKEDIKMIKSHLYDLNKKSSHITNNSSQNYQDQRQHTHSSYDQQQNIYHARQKENQKRMKSQGSQNQYNNNFKHSKVSFKHQLPHNTVTYSGERKITLLQLINSHEKRMHSNLNKNGVSLKSIYPMLKQYKLEGPEFGTLFYGYSKRNSQSVAIKYAQQGVNHIIEVYQRMWKNIAKAHWPCINRIYDYKSQDNNFIIMERNKTNIVGLPAKSILIDMVKILQFIHECGYLYRNIQPEHLMLNQQGQLVVIDFKRAKRYVDIKGHQMDVVDVFNGSLFASNSQLRGHIQGRKDDLQSLGYFGLLLMEFDIPWYGMNREQTIKCRSSLTIQDLFNHHQGWIQYMATIIKTNRNQRPDYKKLLQILQGF